LNPAMHGSALPGNTNCYRSLDHRTKPHPQHKIYPYLLHDLTIDRPNQVWCADISYIPMRRGYLYRVAIMDWASRKILSWRLSNTMDADFCVAALAPWRL
jgi:putative transposase